MKNFIAKLILVFKYNSELKIMLKEMREKLKEDARILKSKNLNLCLAHQQESHGSHYSPHNCDHCIALEKIEALKRSKNSTTRMRGS
jgi:hypothetical protein